MRKPFHDEATMYLHAESRGCEEPIRPARGIMRGMIVGALFWGALGLILVYWRAR